VTLDEARRLGEGAGVVYVPTHGRREDGIIKRVGERYVHVLYRGDVEAKATDPADLEPLLR
jgi:hypothetical protein